MKWFVRVFIAFGLFFFGGITVIALYAEFGLPWKHGEVKKEMKAYLENRYLDEFELEKIRFDWMHGGSYYTYAMAKSTGALFYIERAKDGTVEDGYGYEYWS